VLALLPFYLSFKEIGQRLGIKATTVKTHAVSIYGKLGASTRSEAVELAVEAGLLGRLPAQPVAPPPSRRMRPTGRVLHFCVYLPSPRHASQRRHADQRGSPAGVHR
jgi:hypothetical protein